MRVPARRLLAPPLSVVLLALAACTGGEGPVDAAQQLRVARDPAAMMRIADAAERSGDLASATAFYRRAAELRPDAAAPPLGAARSLAAQGRTDEAIDLLRSAHVGLPGDPLVAGTLGRLLVVAHQPQDALAAFQDGLRAAPGTASLLIGQGVALDALGQHPAAQDSYRAALAVTPDSVPARNDLALSLALSGQADQAATMLRSLRLVANPADRATVDGNLALAYGLQGDAASATALARQTMPEQEVDGNLAFYAALRGQGVAGAAGTVADGAGAGAALPTAGAAPP